MTSKREIHLTYPKNKILTTIYSQARHVLRQKTLKEMVQQADEVDGFFPCLSLSSDGMVRFQLRQKIFATENVPGSGTIYQASIDLKHLNDTDIAARLKFFKLKQPPTADKEAGSMPVPNQESLLKSPSDTETNKILSASEAYIETNIAASVAICPNLMNWFITCKASTAAQLITAANEFFRITGLTFNTNKASFPLKSSRS